ncbi:MAG TPA: hypothetical protein PKI11_03285 [Candidatus Hydrogenedentes bacterium]|nr:hypothetical protein [Candidatus Hydrogenedentota bacterium]HNT89108.1 hypothetical protein [Candidatus Hydrogenedentota bacterium]
MADKPKPVYINGRMTPGEEMIWSPELKSLRRGRRAAPRTEVCRPCLLWRKDEPETKLEGVVLDLNPHGMRVRLLESLDIGDVVIIQMMRDEEFNVPLSQPIQTRVVRAQPGFGDLVDHGVQVILRPIHRAASRPVVITPRPRPRRTPRTRMHTVDITVGDRIINRLGKRRG